MGGKILVVDDDFSGRKLTQEFLAQNGYEVASAPDGRSALEQVLASPPDLLLLDVRMPGLDGFEVCRQVKERPETRLIPVVLLTALHDTGDRVRGLEAGADDFLSKPVDRAALRRGGIVHDIGKVGIPDSVLLKPGRLNLMEWKIMQQHPVIGERICAPLKAFRLVLPIIRHHHERYDGSGYPDGLVGDAIPLTARILQVVDIYDALVTRRPYKPPYTPEEAMQVLDSETQRGWWDARIVAEFRRFMASARPPIECPPALGVVAAVG